MSAFKIVGRHPETLRQEKKRVYTTKKDFDKYKDDLINRYKTYLDVEVYEMINEKWKLLYNVDYIG